MFQALRNVLDGQQTQLQRTVVRRLIVDAHREIFLALNIPIHICFKQFCMGMV
jgi:hypothetical protein